MYVLCVHKGPPKVDKPLPSGEEGGLIKIERRSKGTVSRDVLWSYCVAMGGIFPGTFLMVQFIVVEVFRVGTSLWLTKWTSKLLKQVILSFPAVSSRGL